MSKLLLQRAADLNDTVEFTPTWQNLALYGVLPVLAIICFSVPQASYADKFGAWWGGTWPIILFLVVMLRNISWSPMCRGPYITLTATKVRGRGDILNGAWVLAWKDFDRVISGRRVGSLRGSGIGLFKKGQQFNVPIYSQFVPGCDLIARCIQARYQAYCVAEGLVESGQEQASSRNDTMA